MKIRLQERLVPRGVPFRVAVAVLATVLGIATVHAAATRPAAARQVSASDSGEKSAPVDINSADVDKLTTLPGIGRGIAQRIVEYRKEHGPFKSVDELLNVRGVGERLLTRIRDRVTVSTKK